MVSGGIFLVTFPVLRVLCQPSGESLQPNRVWPEDAPVDSASLTDSTNFVCARVANQPEVIRRGVEYLGDVSPVFSFVFLKPLAKSRIYLLKISCWCVYWHTSLPQYVTWCYIYICTGVRWMMHNKTRPYRARRFSFTKSWAWVCLCPFLTA